MEKLTFTMENYLEAIYELSSDGNGARISDIAERLSVTKASANSAMSTLSEKGLITNEKYKEIFLTPSGREHAEFTSKKHRVIQEFFTKILRVDAVIANRDACAIEHVISNDSIYAMQEFIRTEKLNHTTRNFRGTHCSNPGCNNTKRP
ncbi:metal-dependent transcriptional regulator [Desulfosporosinus lacus]|uniref:Manganese transport regulator n=1 Tax=Desulfosporosinus lacus DSM 15449 TaxID=1121420 RepID=A0A1M6EAI2_9FIRM|nr:metal-dependent transcriptional regulator [Desulfosporosinus lacus]SHI82465.1 iron (metal) dependent repressor, DtxR family [Desulfosporosinus lacus DSM 15449]